MLGEVKLLCVYLIWSCSCLLLGRVLIAILGLERRVIEKGLSRVAARLLLPSFEPGYFALGGVAPAIRQVMMLGPGSTVHDNFLLLVLLLEM